MSPDELRALALDLRAAADRVLSALPAAAPPPAEVTPAYLDVDGFAKRLDVSRSTVRARVAEGMPSRHVGRALRIPVREAEAWLDIRARRETA